MSIFSTYSINVLGGNPFVKGSTIIRFVLICYIDTLCLWTSSFKTKYFNCICLALLEYLSFLEKNNAMKLLQYIFSGLAIRSTIPSLEIKFRSQLAWIVASKRHTNLVSIVDATTTGCFALFHDIAPPAKRNT